MGRAPFHSPCQHARRGRRVQDFEPQLFGCLDWQQKPSGTTRLVGWIFVLFAKLNSGAKRKLRKAQKITLRKINTDSPLRSSSAQIRGKETLIDCAPKFLSEEVSFWDSMFH